MKTSPKTKDVNNTERTHTSHEFYIPSLDGIRAVAAFLVFFSHAGWQAIPGGFGVTIFFFLSGYLITTLLRREYEQSGTISFKHFYLRRVYRIFPPLYIVLIIALILNLTGVFEQAINLKAISAQLFCWTNYYLAAHRVSDLLPGTSVYWSLAIEEHFYIIFPLILLFFFQKFNYIKSAFWLMFFCVVALLRRYWLFISVGLTHQYIYYATDTRFDALLYGCIMGIWLNPILDKDWKINKLFKILLIIAAVGVLIGTFLLRNELFRETLRYSLQGIALFPLFWLAIRHESWPVFRWLNWSPVRFLGVISYTIYLSHEIILLLTRRAFGLAQDIRYLPHIAFAFALTIVFSTAMYYGIERPFARIRKRLHSH